MKASDAKWLKDLEGENARLKKLVANQALDIDMLREVAEGTGVSGQSALMGHPREPTRRSGRQTPVRLHQVLVALATISLAACTSARQTQPSAPASSVRSSDAPTIVSNRESDTSQSGSMSPPSAVHAQCPGDNPLTAAKSFVTAINVGDQPSYTACVYAKADRGSGSLLHETDWASMARSVNAQLDDQFQRSADTYSFGSPDNTPPSVLAAPQY
jgi:hypothetical protein